MLPLRTRARVVADATRLFKVADLDVFAGGQWPVDRMMLDVRDPLVRARFSDLSHLPWGGLLLDDGLLAGYSNAGPAEVVVSGLEIPDVIRPGDVARISPTGIVQNLFRRSAASNFLFATEQCNNFCLMCSQPPRQVDDRWRVSEMMETIELVDPGLECLGITGGEPTLLGTALLDVMLHCSSQLPNTLLHVLTNGRAFANGAYGKSFAPMRGKVLWAVPVYGDTAPLHDYVVQSRGAFSETTRGLYSLATCEQSVEVRVVLQKPTVDRLGQTARFIARSFPFARHVALMGMEPTGLALANREALWVDPLDYTDRLCEAIDALCDVGLNVSVYNLPLCVLPRSVWRFARRSISEWKQTYLDVCDGCAMRRECAGFFGSNSEAWQSRGIHAIH